MEDPTLLVNEIFRSLQGESTFAGLPCWFVRLTGCNLRCVWCDTTYAFHEGSRLTLAAIIDRLESHPCRLVELTGGEPLLQPNSLVLMRRLADRGWQVLLETSGSLDFTTVDPRVVRIVDVKCPSSGESDRNRLQDLACLTSLDQVKLVLADRTDFEFARDEVRARLSSFGGAVLFSPVSGKLAPRELAEWILREGLQVRLQLQLHKLLWPEAARGV